MTARKLSLLLAVSLFFSGSALTAQISEPSAKTAAPTTTKGSTMRYGLSGKLVAKPGQRDALIPLLLRGVEELKVVGCDLYVVSISEASPDAVWVTEVWTSREAHQASLTLPSVRQSITEAMPLLTGEFEQVELSVVGGLGVPSSSSSTRQ